MKERIVATTPFTFYKLLLTVSFFLFTFSNSLYAQGRCALVSEECLDLTSLGLADTIQVPNNTTRLSADGVSICLTPAGTAELPTDMVFTVDQSGSMNWNDPTFYAPTATTTSVRKLYELSPSSYAGLVPFSGSTCSSHGLYDIDDSTSLITDIADELADGTDPSMDTPTLFYPADSAQQQSAWTQFMGTSGYGCGDTDHGTNYVDALTDANTLAQSGSNPLQAIIFITDGVPSGDSLTEGDEMYRYIEWINAGIDIAPVYSIFIGGDSSGLNDPYTAEGRLVQLANLTGGGYFTVAANDPVALETIMQVVVQEAIAPGIPSSTTIENTTLGQTSSADSLDHTDLGNGQYQVSLDSIIGLSPGDTNNLVVTSISVKSGVFFDTTIFNLTIYTTGDDSGSLGDIDLPDSLFDITCVEPSSIFATDGDALNPMSIDSLNFQSTVFGALLESSSGDPDPEVLIEATLSGDNLIKDLSFFATDSFKTETNFSIGSAVVNSSIEGSLGDAIILSWWHPRDSSDFARDTLYISNPTVETPQYTSTNGNPFKSFTEVILFTDTDAPVTIYYTTDGSNPTTSDNVYVPGSPIYVTDDIVIKAFATKTGYLPSGILTADIDRASTLSNIKILRDDTLAFPLDMITTNETEYVIRLQTNYFENSTQNPVIQALGSGDSETLSLAIGDTLGSNGTYDRIYTKAGNNLALGTSATVSNGTLETNDFDTLIISWTNPLDGSDSPKDTVFVQPVNVQSKIWFSTSSSIDDTIIDPTHVYAEGASPIWVIVSDQTIHPDSTYIAVVTSSTAEAENVNLTQQSGYLVGSINANYSALDDYSGFLDINLGGNSLFADYTDPIYGDAATRDEADYPAKSVATPTALPVAGTYFINDTNITLSVTGGALIRYTTDGTDPTNPATASTAHYYTGPIPINSTITIRAVAYFQFDSLSNHVEGGLLTATYFLRDSVGNPFANPATTYFSGDTTVYLIPSDTTDNIWYTTNGTEPDSTDGVNSTRYDYNSPGINITGTTTIKFYSTTGLAVPSDTITEVYTLRAVLDPPTITPGTTTFLTDTTVVITHPLTGAGATIYYTTDGSDPDDTSTEYLGSFTVSTPKTVKAIAYFPPAYDRSSISQADYYPILTVTANPTSTSFDASEIVALTSNKGIAAIYYTLDGNDPDSSVGGSTLLYSSPLTITNTTTVKAIAVLSGWWTSDILNETYTRNSTPSSLKILDQNSVAFAGDIVNADVTSYRVRISTNYEGSTTLTHNDSAWTSDDVEPFNSTTITGSSGSHSRIFNDLYTLDVASSTDSDGTLQVSGTDTLVVTWTNPFDASDVVSDTVYVQPVDTAAVAYFSLTSGGTTTASLAEGTTPVYIVVEDQWASPGLTYQVVLTTVTGESETLTLNTGGAKFTAQIPANYNAVVASDGTLQVNLGGEQLTVTYTDPLYNSDVAVGVADYAGRTVATPTILPVHQTYFQTDTTFTLTTITPGASINYTLDATQPNDTVGTNYSGAVAISATTTIRAVAYISNGFGNVAISNDTTYTLNLRDELAIPYANPSGTYFTEDTVVYLIPADTSNNIWYTTDGSTPDSTSGTSTRYDYNNPGLTLSDFAGDFNGDTLVLMFYSTEGYAIPSDVVTETYIKRDTLVPPTFVPTSTTFLTDSTITLSHPVSGTTIYYTTDGSTPTNASIQYVGPIFINGPITIKAIAYNPPAWVNSAVSEESYIPILTVSASPTSTSFASDINISLSSNNGSATIYYTTDGTDPDSSVTGTTSQYTGTPVNLTNTATVKAIAVLAGWWTSDILSETYTRSSTASLLKILDENGVAFTNDILHADVTAYRVSISTNYKGSSTLTHNDSAWTSDDVEPFNSTTITGSSGSHSRIFNDQYTIALASSTDSDGTMQISSTDTLVVTWVNPFDATDVVSDTVYIQPADTTATAYFSLSSGGAATATYPEATTPVYIVVEDQTVSPALTYQATITAATGESETLTLTPSGGKLIAQLPADYTAIVASDGTLQVSLAGEQLTVTYIDPLYTTDTATGVATYTGKTVAAPTIDPVTGTFFQDDTTFTLATVTGGASINYTIDGFTIPDESTGTNYAGGVFTDTSLIIRAVAYISNGGSNFAKSPWVQFILNKRGVLGIPYANPTSTYFTEDTVVYLIPADTLNNIWFTTNGVNPDSTDGTNSTRYNYVSPGLTLSDYTGDFSGDSLTIKFYATYSTDVPSLIVTEIYVKRDTLVAPTATPSTTSFLGNLDVSLSHPVPNVQIRYTINGGTPTETSPLYSSTLNFTQPTVLRAIAFNPVGVDAWVQSPMMTETYTPILTVSADPASETFDFQDTIVLSSNNPSAAIYYTDDGVTTPTIGSTLYTGAPIIVSATTTIQAIAVLTDWQTSTVLSETYTRNSTSSLLELLDSNGIALPGDILEGGQYLYGVQISTNYGASTTLNPLATTLGAGDSETLTLTTITGASGTHARIFFDDYPFAVGTASASDGTLQSAGYDTIVVTWTNPLDGTDIVNDSLFVRPSDVEANVYLATGNQLSDTTSSFNESHTTIYVIVTDQDPHNDSTYTATITTPTGDTETITLTWQDSMFVGSIAVNYDPTDPSGGTLEVNLGGEQLTVSYTDPIYTSDVATRQAQYDGKFVATPTIDPLDGTWFQTDTSFTLTSATSGTSINYTVNGTQPSETAGTAYAGAVPITTTTVIRAVAYISNGATNFAISNDTLYTLNLRGLVGSPYANPPSTFFTEDTVVFLIPADTNHSIWYTTDGTTPDSATSTLYNYVSPGLTLSNFAGDFNGDTLVINFYSTFEEGVPSAVITETYIKRDTLVPPTADPATTSFLTDTTVTLTHPVSGTSIYYTLDGTTPTNSSTLYTGPITVTKPTVIKAIAYNFPAWVESAVLTETYTPILTVTADPPSETFAFQDTIVLTSNNVTAAIYYTLDGVTVPTAGSTLYTGVPIIVSSTTTIQAIAILTDWQTSEVLSETYTRTSTSSLLELLDSTGFALPGDILEGDQNKYSVRISTNFGDADTLYPLAVTLSGADSETLTLSTITGSSGSFARIFLDNYNFAVASTTTSDGTLQSSVYDTIVVTWTNPLDSTDVVTDSLFVQPSDVTSAIYLATGNQLTDTTTTFTENDNVLFVIVTDQEPHDDSSFTVTITTPTNDVETVTLTWQDSMFVGSIPVDYNNTDANGGTLQINLAGEQIQVTYVDPLYPADNSTETGTFGPRSVATPILVPPLTDSMYFHIDTTVFYSTSTSGALIRYVVGGSDPDFNTGTLGDTAVVSDPISRVNVVAYLYHNDNNYVESEILETIFFRRGITKDPTATPQGPYYTESIDVTLLSFDPANPDSIYYTLDGTDPDRTSDILYTVPVTITGDTVVLSFYAVNGTNMTSNIIRFTYIKRDTLTPPIATPGDGTIFSGSLDVALTHPTVPDARIYYTTDGTEPDSTSNLYSTELTFINPTTLKAVAYGSLTGPDQWVRSVSAEFKYIPKVATPVADPPSGTFLTEIFTQLDVSTQGASIYYTLDGSTPDTNSTPYTQIIRITQSDTLKVVATKEGWANSDVLVVEYLKELSASTLKILDGNQQEVDFLTEKNTTVVILLEATEAGLTTTDAISITLNKADNETVTLLQSGRNGDFYKFLNEVPFSVTVGGTTVTGIIDAQPFDTLVVTWHNPNNPNDSASDRVPVIPFPAESDIYFTDETGGDDRLSEYEGTEDTLYIVVRDQIWDPSQVYTVTLVTNPTYGENRVPDTITLPLVELDSGIYGVAIPVDKNPDANTGDDLLQLVQGDLILATYIDPVNPDTSQALVPYGGPGEVKARVFFTYDGGTEVPDGVFWNPSEDFLYVTYIDDYTEKPKKLTIYVVNTTGTGARTYDTLVIDLGTPVKSDSVGTWRVAIPMDEVENPDGSNNIVEVFFKGDVTASVQSHTKEGTSSNLVTDLITVANPNEDERVGVTNPDGGAEIFRTTDSLTIILTEQDFTGEIDTLLVTVQCLESGDVVNDVILIQQEDGTYLGTIEHNETLPRVTNDGELSCTANDEIRIIYIDPIYGTDDVVTRSITDPTGQTLNFVDPEGNVISNLDEYEGNEFKIVATAFSESTTEIDTLYVTVTTSSGEQIIVTLIETGEFTGVFESDLIEYTFVYGEEVPGEGVLVIDSLNENSFTNSGTVTATLVTDQDSTASSLVVEAAFIPVDKAWIVDGYNSEFNQTGSDGIADTIYVQFLTNLRELPEVINNINWPGDSPDNFTATFDPDAGITEISFYVDENGNIDSSIIVIVLKDADEIFDFGATSTGDGDDASLTLINNNIFKGQTVSIEDRVSPVIVRAERLPSDLEHYEYVDENGVTRYRVNPDSIVITFSEEIIQLTNSGIPWDSLVMFSASCNKDSGHFLITFEGQEPIVLEPDSAGNPRWLFVITNEQGVYKPTEQGCVWLNPDAQYTDVVGNVPSNYDVDPEGLNNSRIINDSYIFHPVVGMEDGGETGGIAGNMVYDADGNLVPVQQIYIEPFGLNPDGTTLSLEDIKSQCGQDPAPETEDFRTFEPNCLSAVYVESQVGYAAHIDIYDHLGKYVYTSTQYFGLCGELENENRRGSDGFRNWLVWNTRDNEGNFVGSGVYIFRVRYLPLPDLSGHGDQEVMEGSILPLAIYKQGIARSEPPDRNCSE